MSLRMQGRGFGVALSILLSLLVGALAAADQVEVTVNGIHWGASAAEQHEALQALKLDHGRDCEEKAFWVDRARYLLVEADSEGKVVVVQEDRLMKNGSVVANTNDGVSELQEVLKPVVADEAGSLWRLCRTQDDKIFFSSFEL